MAIPIPAPDPMDIPEAGPSDHAARYAVSETLSAHNRAVTALRFSNDGSTLVSAGADGWLHVWDPETGDHVRGFKCHKTGINDISISPDSLYIATASDDSTSLIHHLHPPPHPLSQTQHPLDPDSNTNTFPSTSSSSSPTPQPLRVLASHTAPILSLAFSPKSNLLVTGSFDESAIIWDVRRGKPLRVLPAHADAIWCVGWDGEGGMVLTASADGLIRLWDASSGQCLKTIDNDTNSPVSFASFTSSSYFLISATLSSTLRIYNIHTSKVLKTLRAPGTYTSEKFPCPAIVFAAPCRLPSDSRSNGSGKGGNDNGNPEGQEMDIDDHVGAGDGNESGGSAVRGNQSSDQMQVDGEGALTSTLKHSRTKTKADAWIVTGSENGKLVIFDLQSKRVVQVLQGAEEHRSAVVAVATHATIATQSDPI
ncbi:chromatin binding protein [Kwoniella heveanensis BCC8398]|uniref:Chromatin binding protein n=1 Tax=Kwoniella heveanensis BCC8398 TaxID=1296120 RepID=A0A1B9H2Q9_9TREE|nr:chromatin binding protein [Kwoniella heveanensis BCC8398]